MHDEQSLECVEATETFVLQTLFFALSKALAITERPWIPYVSPTILESSFAFQLTRGCESYVHVEQWI